MFQASIDGKFQMFIELIEGFVIKNHGNHFGKHRLKVDQATGTVFPELSSGDGIYTIKFYVNGQMKLTVATCGPLLEGLELTAEAKEAGWIINSDINLEPPLKFLREV